MIWGPCWAWINIVRNQRLGLEKTIRELDYGGFGYWFLRLQTAEGFPKGNNMKTYETYVSLSIWFDASGGNSTELKLILEPSVLNASRWRCARTVHLQLLLIMKLKT